MVKKSEGFLWDEMNESYVKGNYCLEQTRFLIKVVKDKEKKEMFKEKLKEL